MNTVSNFVRSNPIYTAFIAILICGAIFFSVSTVARYDGDSYRIEPKVRGTQITRETSNVDNETSTTFVDDFQVGEDGEETTTTSSSLPPVIIIGSTATTKPRVTTTTRRTTTTTRPRPTTTKRTTTTTTSTTTTTTSTLPTP